MKKRLFLNKGLAVKGLRWLILNKLRLFYYIRRAFIACETGKEINSLDNLPWQDYSYEKVSYDCTHTLMLFFKRDLKNTYILLLLTTLSYKSDKIFLYDATIFNNVLFLSLRFMECAVRMWLVTVVYLWVWLVLFSLTTTNITFPWQPQKDV